MPREVESRDRLAASDRTTQPTLTKHYHLSLVCVAWKDLREKAKGNEAFPLAGGGEMFGNAGSRDDA